MNNRDQSGHPTFGQVIRQRRIELGLTQEALAERVGDNVRQSEISRLERDYVTLPRRNRLEAIARALEVSPVYLLMHSGWMSGDEARETSPQWEHGMTPPPLMHEDSRNAITTASPGVPLTATPTSEPGQSFPSTHEASYGMSESSKKSAAVVGKVRNRRRRSR